MKNELTDIWRKFLSSNFKFEFFTEALYQHLIIWCGFTAHFNREEFYNYYFALNNVDNTFRFVKQFLTGRSAELGLTYWLEKNSVNQEMVRIMSEQSFQVEAYLNSLRFLLLKYQLDNVLSRISLMVDSGFVFMNNEVLLNKGYEEHILVPLDIMHKVHQVVKFYYDAEYKHYLESIANDADDTENIKNHIWNDISAVGLWIAQNNIPYEVKK